MRKAQEFGEHFIGDTCPAVENRYVEDLMRSDPSFASLWPTMRLSQLLGDALYAGNQPRLRIFAYMMDKPLLYEAKAFFRTFTRTGGLNNPPLAQFQEGQTFDLKTQNLETVVRVNTAEAEYESLSTSGSPEVFSQSIASDLQTSDKIGIVWQLPRTKRKILLCYPEDGIEQTMQDTNPLELQVGDVLIGNWSHQVTDNYPKEEHRIENGVGLDLAWMRETHLIGDYFLRINQIDVLQVGKSVPEKRLERAVNTLRSLGLVPVPQRA